MNEKTDNLHMDALAAGLECMIDEWFGDESTFVLLVAHPAEDGGGRVRVRTSMCEAHTALALATMAKQYAERHRIDVATLETLDEVRCTHQ